MRPTGKRRGPTEEVSHPLSALRLGLDLPPDPEIPIPVPPIPDLAGRRGGNPVSRWRLIWAIGLVSTALA